MRLAQLQLKGFKSFADETTINFGEQVIGIVGPNGSGKSNIIDAIKWVLGEQKNRELRLETMSDVLFNGAKGRKEGKVARVTLNFQNTKNILPTEYNEVSISRLIYRNGQSEYRLNNVPCRRKDITSLFLDSGLGSHSYAIISLAMVEDILTDKDNSRGRMIEEASGINKYKVRKRETLNKLKGTQTDLDRIEDLLFELKTNLKTFEKQARRTERYIKIKEEFKSVSLAYTSGHLSTLHLELDQLTNRLKQESTAEIEISARLNTEEANLQEVKKNIVEKEGNLSKFQRSHNELKDSISKLENGKVLHQNEQKYLHESLTELKMQITTLSNELISLSRKIEASMVSKGEQIREKEKIDQSLKEKLEQFKETKIIYDDVRSTLLASEGERSKISQEIDRTGREISAKQSQIDLLNEQLKTKEKERSRIVTDIDELHLKHKKVVDDLAKLDSQFTEKQGFFNELNDKIVTTETVLSETADARKRTELKQDGLKQRISILQNVINNYEGFGESIRFLHRERRLQYPVFTDILEINDSAYTDIIEFYFHSYLQHIVVNSKKEAKPLNELIRSSQKGKVNFLLRNEYAENTHQNRDSEDASNDLLISLISFLTFQEQYQHLIGELASNAYLFEGTLDELDPLTIPKGGTVLLPKELLIYKKGEIKGGSLTLFDGVNIGRRKSLEELEENLEKTQIQHKKLLAKESECREILSNHKVELSTAMTAIQVLEPQLEAVKTEIHSFEGELKLKNTILKELEETNRKANKHISNIQIELLELEKFQNNVSQSQFQLKDLDEIKDNFSRYHSNFEKAREAKEILEKEELLFRNRLDLISRDIDILINTQKDKQKQVDECEAKLSKSVGLQHQLEKEIGEVDVEVQKLYEVEKTEFSNLNSKEEEYFQLKSGVDEKEKQIYELRGKRDKSNHLLGGLKEKISEKKAKMTALKDRAEVEFNVILKSYQIEEELKDQALENLEERKDRLGIQVRNFGDINPLAIEAYNEIKLRYEKIAEERDDILVAKQNLEETISDIETTATELFTDALDKIRHHFKEVFRSLFSDDDDCDIVLLNADNPLESSIEIMAKPKGKQPKSINQLSGGEKTLTAVSFLFALYLIKPAPFCIFDEVDAPLDDLNVQKFNKIIKSFSKDSQFIIVTHNKATMAEMDILYGVFMREKGVSGVSAVDFSDFKKIDLYQSAASN